MFSKFLGLIQAIGARTKAGVDKHGNIYYCKADKLAESRLGEKRWVEFKGAPDVSTIPVQWSSWLSGTRRAAPTAQEIIEMEAQRENVRSRAAMLKNEEEKQRFRMKASQQEHQAEQGSPEDLEIIMQQIGSRESASSIAGKGETKRSSHTRYTKERDVSSPADPVAWQPPGKVTRSTEPKGSGENFEPGTWRP